MVLISPMYCPVSPLYRPWTLIWWLPAIRRHPHYFSKTKTTPPTRDDVQLRKNVMTQSNPGGRISVDRGTVAALSTNNTSGMLVRLSRICRTAGIQKVFTTNSFNGRLLSADIRVSSMCAFLPRCEQRHSVPAEIPT